MNATQNEENVTPTPQEPTEIKVPIRTYLHPDTGSRITYVSTIHAAQPAHYTALAKIIEAVETKGGTIYYERVTHPGPEELAAAPEHLRWGAEAIKKKLDFGTKYAADAGLVLQKHELPQREGWQNHDLTTLQAAEIYGDEELRRQDDQRQQTEYFLSNMTADLRSAMMLQTLAASVKFITGEASIEEVLPKAEREMAAAREAIVLTALDQQLTDTPGHSFALVWGAGHLPSYADALTERGYKEEGEHWITAIDTRAGQPPEA